MKDNMPQGLDMILQGFAVLLTPYIARELEAKANLEPQVKRTLNVKEAMEFLGVGENTLYKLKKQGEIPEPIKSLTGKNEWPYHVLRNYRDKRDRELKEATHVKRVRRTQRKP